jgi:hypothetical protein
VVGCGFAVGSSNLGMKGQFSGPHCNFWARKAHFWVPKAFFRCPKGALRGPKGPFLEAKGPFLLLASHFCQIASSSLHRMSCHAMPQHTHLCAPALLKQLQRRRIVKSRAPPSRPDTRKRDTAILSARAPSHTCARRHTHTHTRARRRGYCRTQGNDMTSRAKSGQRPGNVQVTSR